MSTAPQAVYSDAPTDSVHSAVIDIARRFMGGSVNGMDKFLAQSGVKVDFVPDGKNGAKGQPGNVVADAFCTHWHDIVRITCEPVQKFQDGPGRLLPEDSKAVKALRALADTLDREADELECEAKGGSATDETSAKIFNLRRNAEEIRAEERALAASLLLERKKRVPLPFMSAPFFQSILTNNKVTKEDLEKLTPEDVRSGLEKAMSIRRKEGEEARLVPIFDLSGPHLKYWRAPPSGP